MKLRNAIAMIAALLMAATISADTNSKNHDFTQRQSLSWKQYFFPLTRLGNFWLPQFGIYGDPTPDGDSLTEPLGLYGVPACCNRPGCASYPPEQKLLCNHLYDFGSDGFHETWYISRDSQGASTGPMYRHFSSSLADHMDSPSFTEAPSLGYVRELQLGWSWTTPGCTTGVYCAGYGTKAMTRYLKTSDTDPTVFDHMTWMNGPPPAGYATDAVYSTATPTPRYAFPRFGNKLDRTSALQQKQVVEGGGKIQVFLSKVWGYAISDIRYLPTGAQLVANSDIGYLAQSTVFIPTSIDPTGECCAVNPTQSGGNDYFDHGDPNGTFKWAGSPVWGVTGGSNPNPVSFTVRPLSYNFNLFTDGVSQDPDAYTPLAWHGTFSKTINVGYQYPEVVKLDFAARVDDDSPIAMYSGAKLNNTWWLLAAPFGGSGYQIELYNLDTGQGTIQTKPTGWGNVPNNYVDWPFTKNKAVILAKNDGSFAIGVMAKSVDLYISDMKVMQWIDPPSTQLLVIDIFNDHNLTAGTAEHEDAYMALGTTACVEQRLRQLYCAVGSRCTVTTQNCQ